MMTVLSEEIFPCMKGVINARLKIIKNHLMLLFSLGICMNHLFIMNTNYFLNIQVKEKPFFSSTLSFGCYVPF